MHSLHIPVGIDRNTQYAGNRGVHAAISAIMWSVKERLRQLLEFFGLPPAPLFLHNYRLDAFNAQSA
jgi:hypothetical protein